MGIFKKRSKDAYENHIQHSNYTGESDVSDIGTINNKEDYDSAEDCDNEDDEYDEDYEDDYDEEYEEDYIQDYDEEDGESKELNSTGGSNHASNSNYTKSKQKRYNNDKRNKHSFEEGAEYNDNEGKNSKRIVKAIIVLVSMILSLIGAYLATKLIISKQNLDKLSVAYSTNINNADIIDSELKKYIPKDYVEDPEVLRYRYALDRVLEDRNITVEIFDTKAIEGITGYSDMTVAEQTKAADDYKYKVKQDELLKSYLESLRNSNNTDIDVTYTLDAVDTSNGETNTVTINSKEIDSKLYEQLENLSETNALYNINIKDKNYSTVSLVDKKVNYTYKPEVIIQAKDNLDLDLNNVMATLIITRREE